MVWKKISVVALAILILPLAACWYGDENVFSDGPGSIVPASSEESEVSVDEQAERYQAAADLEALDNFEDAARVFASLGDYSDAEARSAACFERQKEEDYREGLSLFEEKRYAEAETFFAYLGDYLDSADYVIKCQKGESREKFWALLTEVEAGGTLSFGRMEQDGNTRNGAEELEWVVIRKEENRILFLAKDILNRMPMFDSLPDAESDPEEWTWEHSLPAEWLNGAFAEEVFTAEEREMIRFGLDPSDADDESLVRLLTLSEAMELPKELLQIGGEEQDGRDASSLANSWWVMPEAALPGESPVVGPDGEIAEENSDWTKSCGIRPVFWIGH